jgi:hypothetical protein
MTQSAPTKQQVLDEMRRIHAGKLKIPPEKQLAYLQGAISKIADPVLREALEILFLSTKESSMSEKLKGDIHGSAVTPWGVLMEAVRAVPAVKYTLGIAGIVSVLAIVVELRVNFRVAVVGTVIMLILMAVLLAFARLSAASNRSVAAAGVFFLWSSLLLFVGTGGMMFSSVFFHWPLDLRSWLVGSPEARRTGTQSGEGVHSTEEVVKPGQKVTQRVVVGGNFGLQVDGCESRGQRFSAAAPGEVDASQGSYRGFDLDVMGNNGHGVRNISVDGNTISFEAYADGTGTREGVLGCVGAKGANVSVNVYAYVKK